MAYDAPAIAARLAKPVAGILISPGSIDGYPPVQNQARLLADAGFAVEVLTVPRPGARGVEFSHPGVTVTSIQSEPGRGVQTLRRVAAFAAAVTRARLRVRDRRVVEIAYDPIGIFYSDLAPLKPKLRIAHLHENLQNFETQWIERRLPGAIGGFDITVAPDHARSRHIWQLLGMQDDILVVPNYPLRSNAVAATAASQKASRFEVIYCGTIGPTQKLEFIIDSVDRWPDEADLVVIGDDSSAFARSMKARADPSRVRFEGWIAQHRLDERLGRAWLGISLLDHSRIQWRSSLGASNKRYQYMQAGLPQIGDMNDGVADLLEGNRIGRCVSSFSSAELAGIVAEYASDRARCLEEGRRALQLHRETLNYEVAFAPMLARIEQSLRGL